MGEITIPMVLQNLTKLLKDEANLLYGLKGQVRLIQGNLTNMISFLKDNAANDNRRAKKVVKQIMEVASEVENVIDSYMAPIVAKKQRKANLPLAPGNVLHFFRYVKALRVLVNKTRSIREVITCFNDNEEISSGTSTYDEYSKAKQIAKGDDVVGFDHHTKSLVNRLIDPENSRLDVVSIIGMAGLGKTTLAMKIYNLSIHDHQFDCGMVVYISQEYTRRTLLLEILEFFRSDISEELPNMSDEVLVATLRDCLRRRRYLILIDGIWTNQVWEEVKEAFPDDSNGSRILITSRDKEIASHASPGTPPYFLSFLDKDASWELLCKNSELAFLKKEDSSSSSPDVHEYLKILGKQLVESCKGLPISIIELGKVLAKEGMSSRAWSNILDNVLDGKYFKTRSSKSSCRCLDYVGLSYNHLPCNLKPCFLYLGMFPQDHEIETKELIRLWIAEGLINVGVQQTDQNKTVEAVAESYLDKLINKSLIQVARRRRDGGVKTCRIHNIIRDFCITESLKEKFFMVRSEDDHDDDDDDDYNDVKTYCIHSLIPDFRITKSSKEKFFKVRSDDDEVSSSMTTTSFRSLSFHCTNRHYYESWNTCNAPSVRSLLLFCSQEKWITFNGENYTWLATGFRFIRVLLLFNVELYRFFDDKDDSAGKLIFLRYLRVSTRFKSGIYHYNIKLNTLCNLRYLETVDIEANIEHGINSEPMNIWRMERLKHLACGRIEFPEPDRKAKGNTLSNLKVLSYLYVTRNTADFISKSKFPNLEDLGLFYDHEADTDQVNRLNESEMAQVVASLEKLTNLQRLRVVGLVKYSDQPRLQFLASTLKKVTLSKSFLESNLLRILGRLPNLLVLKMVEIEWESEEDMTIRMVAGEFPQLQFFKMSSICSIKFWELERNAMPNLQHLVIIENPLMKSLPSELWCMEALRVVEMSRISESLRKSLRELDCFKDERHLEVPPVNSRNLQGSVSELNMKNGCKVLIQGPEHHEESI